MKGFQIIDYGSNLLKSKQIKSYKLDSELILAKVLNKSREELLTNLQNKIDFNKLNKFKNLINRRKLNEPIAYIFKNKDFWKSSFKVSKDVLIPRPETEIIVEEVLKLTDNDTSKRLLDVGTGSGCIIISIKKERPKLYVTGIDISKKALKTAICNAKMHHLLNKIKFINIDIDKFKDYKYDFIVSNPPYINDYNIKRLDINVKQFEPLIALRAGNDGLKVIKKLILKSKKLLKRNGILIFEIGENQETKVRELLMKNRYYINKVCKDIRSVPRVVISTKLF
tara:strand:+ start:1383 stop:2228 length:846 start_codon:yes stop_codon:yes gene_type:complete